MSVSDHARPTAPPSTRTGGHRGPRPLAFPDTSHLSPEDAELLRALYVERNTVSRGEAARVRWNAEHAHGRREPDQPRGRAA